MKEEGWELHSENPLTVFKSGPPPVNHPYSSYCWFPSYVSPWKISFMPVVPSQSFPVLHYLANRKCVPLVTRKSMEFDCLKGLGWLWEVVSLMTLLNQPISCGLQAEYLNTCWEPGRSSSIFKNWPQKLILESSMGREYSLKIRDFSQSAFVTCSTSFKNMMIEL